MASTDGREEGRGGGERGGDVEGERGIEERKREGNEISIELIFTLTSKNPSGNASFESGKCRLTFQHVFIFHHRQHSTD